MERRHFLLVNSQDIIYTECFERKQIQRKEKYLDARKRKLIISDEMVFTTL